MSFLEPLLLAGLPLAGLPILIHLINQRRFQNIDWGAMRFLLEANRMSRGYARIRQWLILAARVAAVAALVVAISRPLASGWLGLASGGRPDATIVLLDRSPSMSERGATAASSKLQTGVRQLADTLEALGPSRWILIDSVTLEPQELQAPTDLASSALATPASASADLPALLQAAHDYIRANRTGQTEIWICSDLRANDWNAASGRWQTLRDSFLEFQQGVRFHLLAYPHVDEANAAVRVTDVRRVESSEGAQLLVSLALSRTGGSGKLELPVRVEIEGARSEVAVEMEGRELAIKDHPVPLEAGREQGWGRISIPADANPADNEFYFAFARSPPRRTVIVAEDAPPLRALQLAAAIPPEPGVESDATFVAPEAIGTVEWEDAALAVWQAPLPTGDHAKLVQSFVDRGGQVLFVPPPEPSDAQFGGVRWTAWRETDQPVGVETWRSDQDLLGRTQSGAALPAGVLAIHRYCELEGEVTPLATLYGGEPLLARAPTRRGGVYFLATTTAPSDSSLAINGVVLYAAIQRAVSAGAAQLSTARQATAGELAGEAVEWRQTAGPSEVLSTEYAHHAGVYSRDDRLWAINRSVDEDKAAVLDDARVAGLFQGLDFDRVDDRAGSMASLTREIWRAFLATMLVAMVAEAALCVPKRPKAAGELAA
jgi:hypothetical protein